MLFLQGTAQIHGGAATVIGDGIACVGGSTIRLMTRFVERGGGFVPEPGEPRLSGLGSIPPGGGVTVYCQSLHRNNETFCTPATLDYSNGHQIVWTPQDRFAAAGDGVGVTRCSPRSVILSLPAKALRAEEIAVAWQAISDSIENRSRFLA